MKKTVIDIGNKNIRLQRPAHFEQIEADIEKGYIAPVCIDDDNQKLEKRLAELMTGVLKALKEFEQDMDFISVIGPRVCRRCW